MTYEREYILPQILEEACDQNQLQVDEAGRALYAPRDCVNSASRVQGSKQERWQEPMRPSGARA
jgi:hypothetical protein